MSIGFYGNGLLSFLLVFSLVKTMALSWGIWLIILFYLVNKSFKSIQKMMTFVNSHINGIIWKIKFFLNQVQASRRRLRISLIRTPIVSTPAFYNTKLKIVILISL